MLKNRIMHGCFRCKKKVAHKWKNEIFSWAKWTSDATSSFGRHIISTRLFCFVRRPHFVKDGHLVNRPFLSRTFKATPFSHSFIAFIAPAAAVRPHFRPFHRIIILGNLNMRQKNEKGIDHHLICQSKLK